MKFFYDRKSDSLYLTLSERNEYRDSFEAAPGVVLDFDGAGRLLGIDLERASRIIDVADLELHEEPIAADAETARIDGARLRKAREQLGLSQLELARKLSVSPNTVARWERGELKIQHSGMLQLALQSLRPTSTTVPKRAIHPPQRKSVAAYAKQVGRSSVTGRFVEASSSRGKSGRTAARRAPRKK